MILKAPFTQRELDLLIELLESEARGLQTEIDHTDARRMKDKIRRRMQAIHRLDDRLRMMSGEPTFAQSMAQSA